MSDAVVAPAPAKATKKAPKVKKAKTTSTHPKYSTMVSEAIKTLKERSGSSRQAIVKYIVANYLIAEKTASIHVKLALKRGVGNGSLKQVKGVGASGSFRLVKAEGESKPKKAAVKKAKKPASKKPAKKTSEKKTPKKKAAKKPSVAKKSPAKKLKAKKTPAKKPVAKKSSKPKKPVAKKAKK